MNGELIQIIHYQSLINLKVVVYSILIPRQVHKKLTCVCFLGNEHTLKYYQPFKT